MDGGEARIRGNTGDAAVIEVVQVLDGAGDGCRVVRLDGGPDVLPDTVKHHKGGVELVGRRVKLEALGQNNALDPDGGAVIQVVRLLLDVIGGVADEQGVLVVKRHPVQLLDEGDEKGVRHIVDKDGDGVC